MPDGPMPAQGAPAPEGGGAGGGVGAVIQDVDGKLSKIAEAIGGSQLPDELKAQAAGVLEGWRALVEGVMAAAEGGGAAGPQPVSPEAGAGGGAVPMSPAGAKR